MTATDTFNTGTSPLSPDGRNWAERVVQADHVWQQVKALLDGAQLALPTTPRRPDVRLIVENISGAAVEFFNPGDHSKSKPEVIPAAGDTRAVMVMVAGNTLLEQLDSAANLYGTYGLATQGLAPAFVTDLKRGALARFVSEAYGPASFTEQAGKLAEVTWPQANGASELLVRPVIGAKAAFGVRPAAREMAVLTDFPIFVKGTTTTPEKVESEGMVIVASENWQDRSISTRPIVPSVARGFYGAHYDRMPIATVDPDGTVQQLDLRNGTVLTAPRPVVASKPARMQAPVRMRVPKQQ